MVAQNNNTDKTILSEIAKEIASEVEVMEVSSVDNFKSDIVTSLNNKQNRTSKNKNSKKRLSISDLEEKKQVQNLAERKTLLKILAFLFAFQLLFMNIVVILIIAWSVFKFGCFRQVDSNTLNSIFDFTKYYITAVLVELLGGIIYIVTKVFSHSLISNTK